MSNPTHPRYHLVTENPHSTVVGQYVPDVTKARDANYQTEADLESAFIRQLESQAYDYLPITSEADLVGNLRTQLEQLNKIQFSDGEGA